MGKQQIWSMNAFVFLFLSLASKIYCRSHTHLPSHNTSHLNVIRRESVPSQKEKDLIDSMPGQPSVNFKQYGGYVAVNETAGRFLYYYFVEAIKPTDSTPLVFWFNGGPGCSSLGSGAFKELGPFRVHSDGKTLYRNPYSWNNEANVLFLESPAGVGFSYSSSPIDTYEFGEQGDKLTAEDNYMFLVNWLERFPEYKGREFYLAGQSYAGHYIPQLAQIILNRNNQTFINLRGILVGNPGLDYGAEFDGMYEFKLTHGLISQANMDSYKKLCDRSSPTYVSTKCILADVKIKEEQIKDLDEYNIYAPVCLNSTLSSEPNKFATVMNVDPCMKNFVEAYLRSEKVQEAIHANTTKLPYAWEFCAAWRGDWSDEDKEASMIPILHELMGEGIRVWVYSGDVDMAVPITSTLDVLKKMNLSVVNEWRPWFTGGQVGGYTEYYKGNFTYATVRGAGHSVPMDQPIRALTIFTSFIRNTPLPQTP